MTDRGTILARLIELASKDAQRRQFPQRLGLACRDILGADGTAITFDLTSSRRTTLAATDEIAARLVDLQDVTGEGPCWEASRTSETVVARLTDTASNRWPAFTQAALDAVGPVTMHAIPMLPAGQSFGVFSAYVTGDRELAQSTETARFLADAVGMALLQDPPDPFPLETESAWTSRARVHQATGMVVAQLGVPVQDALALLRGHAYAIDLPLAEVAELIVSRRLTFTKDGDHDDGS